MHLRSSLPSTRKSHDGARQPKVGFKWKLIYSGIARYHDIRDTVNPIYSALSELVGLYVEEV
jgi:hypothetical protein